jgi:hypothetical protein
MWITILWITMPGALSREYASKPGEKYNRGQVTGILTLAAISFSGSAVLSSRYPIPETKMLARSQ